MKKYYMGSLDSMVDEGVKNFKMRVRNLFRERQIEEALQLIDRYCKLTHESIKELIEPASRKLLKDLIKALFVRFRYPDESSQESDTSDKRLHRSPIAHTGLEQQLLDVTTEEFIPKVKRYAEKHLKDEGLQIAAKFWHVILLSKQNIELREIDNILGHAAFAHSRFSNDVK